MKENQLEQKCATCHSLDTSEVINTETNTRQGWLCKKCGEFTTAVGRERLWKAKRAESMA
jgi:transposase-like protein